ncbi:hypothetical protein GCM10010319_47060 [Streptomyces blastmyceticus]|uniref:Uncharacterized protein n=1 Tax=Streptomyces blastmyceticus TaxID=68180 RepID=A0ABP3HBS0_9ACTN
MSKVECHPADNDPPTRVPYVVGRTGEIAGAEPPPLANLSAYETSEFRSALRGAVAERVRMCEREIET